MARLAAAERSLQDAKEMIDALETDKLTLEHSHRSLQATVDQLTSSNSSLKDKLYEQRETLNAQMRDLRRSAAETVRQYEEERTAVQSHLTKVRIPELYLTNCVLQGRPQTTHCLTLYMSMLK